MIQGLNAGMPMKIIALGALSSFAAVCFSPQPAPHIFLAYVHAGGHFRRRHPCPGEAARDRSDVFAHLDNVRSAAVGISWFIPLTGWI